MTIDPERLVFVDETGTSIDMIRTHARALKGERVGGEVPRNRGRATTLIGAIALRGLVAAMTVEGGTTGAIFENYVKYELAPQLEPGDVVVWDNLAAHHVKAARAAIEEAGALLIYTPPYSPEYNPIELCWSKVKKILRDLGARTAEDLGAAIQLALESVTPSDLQGWFAHCGYLPAQLK